MAWYDCNRRDLPWRARAGETPDPYAVWLSEIMLQQTTVEAVKPYFIAFLARWPNVEALARAPLEDVTRAWAGLGYYARARNLHACARLVATTYRGRFPASEAELLELPGVGPYNGGGGRGDRLRTAGGRDGRQCPARSRAPLRGFRVAASRQGANTRIGGELSVS